MDFPLLAVLAATLTVVAGFLLGDPMLWLQRALVMVVAGSHVPVRDPQLRARARVGLLRAAAARGEFRFPA